MDKESFSSRLTSFTHRGLAFVEDDSAATRQAVVVAAAAFMSPARVNEILHLTGGHLFVALDHKRADAFMLAPMTTRSKYLGDATGSNSTPDSTAPRVRHGVCVSVEARSGVTTGISTADRAHTISILGAAEPNPRMLVKPGHIFPVVTRPGGVLVKHALPEGALDLVKIGGHTSAALYCDLLNSSGAFADIVEQQTLAQEHQIPVFSLSEIVRHRLETELLIQRVAQANLPTRGAGELTAYIYRSSIHGGEHLALVKGVIDGHSPTLVRVQTESTFSDVFASKRKNSRAQIAEALTLIGQSRAGVLLYLRRPYLGGVSEEVRSLESGKILPPSAVMREYGVGAQILRDLGISKVELLTSSKKNLVGLKPFGIEIVSQKLIQQPAANRSESQRAPHLSIAHSS